MKWLRTLALTAFLIMLLIGSVRGADLPREAQQYLPEEETATDFWSEAGRTVRQALRNAMPEITEAAGICAVILGVAVLCSVFHAAPASHAEYGARMLGAIGIMSAVLTPGRAMVELGTSVIRDIGAFGLSLLPVMTSAMAASGGFTASGALYVGTAWFNELLQTAITRVLMPLLFIQLALSFSNAALGNDLLRRLRDLIKWMICWGLKAILYIFLAYMAITGVVSGSADAGTVKAAKLAISGAIPVVGGIIADASEAVVLSAGMIRRTAGIAGILGILAICALPVLRIGIQYLLLKLTAAVCGVVGMKAHAELTDDLAAAMGLMLAMTGASCLLMLFSLVCFMKGAALP